VKNLIFFYFVILLLTLYPNYSFAYIDPATISVVVQGIIGAVAGGLVAIKIYWNKVKAFVRSLQSKLKERKLK
tara:strand:+ start:71 stop:289 length:219 start_codon:yes stop_codon:yes gene_type:complete